MFSFPFHFILLFISEPYSKEKRRVKAATAYAETLKLLLPQTSDRHLKPNAETEVEVEEAEANPEVEVDAVAAAVAKAPVKEQAKDDGVRVVSSWGPYPSFSGNAKVIDKITTKNNPKLHM